MQSGVDFAPPAPRAEPEIATRSCLQHIGEVLRGSAGWDVCQFQTGHVTHDTAHKFDRLRIVDGCWESLLVVQLNLTTETSRCRARKIGYPLSDLLAHPIFEPPRRPADNTFRGKHVPGAASMDLRCRDNG